jgi:undecaprenyl pyrophosphate phosphatase UppP
MVFDFNMWSMLAGGLAAVGIGFVWYLPAVFGNSWMKLVNMDSRNMEDAKKKMPMMALAAFVAAFVLSWVLAQFALVWGAVTVGSVLELGFWVWLGFMVPVLISPVLWEQKPIQYFAINAGYWFVTTLAIAAIVGMWS